MGKAEEELEVAQKQKQPVKLLACTCGDCLHWELGIDELGNQFILCKTCSHQFPAQIVVDEHEKLQWQNHER